MIGAYVAWAELVLQPLNTWPSGTVTSGLPYRFLNSLEWPDRAVFYGTNLAVGVAILLAYASIAWGVRRRFPVPVAP